MGHPDFRVGGKIFATLHAAGSDSGMVSLHPEQQEMAMDAEPEAFRPAAGAWGRGGSTLVTLSKVSDEWLERTLDWAWQKRRPAESGRRGRASELSWHLRPSFFQRIAPRCPGRTRYCLRVKRSFGGIREVGRPLRSGIAPSRSAKGRGPSLTARHPPCCALKAMVRSIWSSIESATANRWRKLAIIVPGHGAFCTILCGCATTARPSCSSNIPSATAFTPFITQMRG